MAKKPTKARNWSFMLWIDSMPSYWQTILKETGLPFAVSPLHDKDKWTEEDEKMGRGKCGELKKAHYHIIISYPGPTTFNCVSEFVSSLGSQCPQPIGSVEGLYRYFTHLDDPHKYQYSSDDIIHQNGFDIRDYISLTKNEIIKLKKDICLYIRKYNILEYRELMDLLLDNDLTDEWEVASTNTVFFDRYIASGRYSQKTEFESDDSVETTGT